MPRTKRVNIEAKRETSYTSGEQSLGFASGRVRGGQRGLPPETHNFLVKTLLQRFLLSSATSRISLGKQRVNEQY